MDVEHDHVRNKETADRSKTSPQMVEQVAKGLGRRRPVEGLLFLDQSEAFAV